jgi:osmotically-inducible protein OsmY
MAKLDFEIGARVHCTDGDCGRLSKVVIDPHTQRVTDLIVEKGFLLTTDRVVPGDAVDRADDEGIHLTISSDHLRDYPEYKEIAFREPAPEARAGGYDRGDVRCWQDQYSLACSDPVIPMVRRRIHKGISSELAVIERGTPVKDDRGTVGHVDHVLVSPESGEITHLVMRKGLVPYYPILPVSHVLEVSDEAVTIDLTDEQLQRSIRYKSRDAEDIRAELLDRMEGLGFDLSQIAATVEGQIVRLTGWVPSVAAKRRAEALARSIEGVVDVENSLDTDIVIQTRVMNALLNDPRTSVAVIDVINESGVVTLQGQIDSVGIQEAAVEIAESQPGVLSVVNALEVKPDADTEWLTARSLAATAWPDQAGGSLR